MQPAGPGQRIDPPHMQGIAGKGGDIGKIAVGKQADLAFFDLEDLRFSGAGDPLAALILCGAHHADRVMVQGRWTVTDGNPVGIDIAQLRHDHGVAARALLETI